ALIREHARELGVGGADPAAWAPALARFSGIASAEGRESYVHDAVLPSLPGRSTAAGASRSAAVDPCGPAPTNPDGYAGAVQRPSSSHNSRPSGETGRVHMVIIHTCEGSYAGCWSWLANPQSGVSAHYVVREDGGEITQLVPESRRAWHIGARYDCSLNGGHDCALLNGVQSNDFTVGVEHAGYASQTSWPAAQIEASARLVCDVTRRHGIPRDRFHVVAHGQLQPHNRTDPGANWPWTDYLNRIDAHCGGA
ncbi:MAG TPA: N-acetylmuramoyl-L-alanine amidase, partial [Longimicrobiaceae bacterium]|nr:N-acetylmuramoyl-L-alanine amidase [Longimicrobiaceae bacterium]